ncbi:MAG TPA: response regulator [Candidatus Paceibacterota bacterium]
MKILIVEDEEILGKVLEEKFENNDFKVSIAKDGESVLTMAKKFNPDIILLDIILPKLDGLEVLAKLKSDEDLKDIPVIMLSNLNEDDKIKQALSLGAVDYMTKIQHPINEVIDKVNRYILKAK